MKNLKVEDYELNFSPDIYLYKVKTNKSQLNIKVELNDISSTYKITGNNDLKDGSIISIIVTDSNGNNSIYKIEIEQIDKSNWIVIILIISILINIVLVIYIIFISRKNKCVVKCNKPATTEII